MSAIYLFIEKKVLILNFENHFMNTLISNYILKAIEYNRIKICLSILQIFFMQPSN